MKLRIRGNSIRLRVTQTELASFAERGELRDVIVFSPGSWLGYSLRVAEKDEALAAGFSAQDIVVSIPASLAREWVDTERVSLRGQQRLDNGDCLDILVEKDFACLVPREGEDDSDAFPHPESETGKSC